MLTHLLATGSPASFWPWLSVVALVASAFFVLFGVRASQSRKDLTDSVTALQGRLDSNQDEIRELRETNATQAALIASQKRQIDDLNKAMDKLERVVTSRDEIAAQTRVLTVGFTTLGVDPKVLEAAAKANGSNGR